MLGKVYTCVQMISHVRLFVTPQTVAHQAPLSVELPRQECWSWLPFPPPGDRPNPGIKPASLRSPALAGRFFTTSTIWEALGEVYIAVSLEEGSFPLHWESNVGKVGMEHYCEWPVFIPIIYSESINYFLVIGYIFYLVSFLNAPF